MQAAYADKGRGDRGIVPPQRQLVDLGGVLVSPHGLLEVALALAYPPDVVQDLDAGHHRATPLLVEVLTEDVDRVLEARHGPVELAALRVDHAHHLERRRHLLVVVMEDVSEDVLLQDIEEGFEEASEEASVGSPKAAMFLLTMGGW